MTAPTVAVEPPWPRALARAGAYALDTLLAAYALWTLHALGVGALPGGGLLARFPWLLALAPLLAALAQACGASVGLAAYGLRALDTQGRPASRERRALAALLVGLTGLGLGVVGALAGVTLAAALALLLVLVPAGLGEGASLAEHLAGLRWRRRAVDEAAEVVPLRRRPTAWVVLVLLGLTFAVGADITSFAPGRLVEPEGLGNAQRILKDLLRIDLSILPVVLERLVETVFIALLASVLALPFAFVLAFVGSRNLTAGSVRGRAAYGLARVAMNVMRSIEPLVWVIIFSLWVGVGPFAGLLALWIHSVAALGKLYSEAIEGIDPGPVEAMRATGARPAAVLRYGVVPQVVPPFLGFTVYRWDINVRMATILGLVGGGGIGEMLIYYQQVGQWPKVGTILLCVTLIVWVMDMASSRARQKLV